MPNLTIAQGSEHRIINAICILFECSLEREALELEHVTRIEVVRSSFSNFRI